jgi:uncharacterized protein
MYNGFCVRLKNHLVAKKAIKIIPTVRNLAVEKRWITMQNWFVYICIGFTGGVLSGLLGLGGGIIIIPMLILMGLPQLAAQGTTLALMVLPIGLLGAIEYYKNGHVEVVIGLLVVAGFFLGTLLGAKSAMKIHTVWLKRIFGVIMIFAALRIMFAK